jgi:AraC-like DNA-binding protein
MSASAPNRRVDWSVVSPGDLQPSRASLSSSPSRLIELTAEVTTAPSPHSIASLLRHAIEYARVALELERAALFLLHAKHGVMVGTFGTGASGETVDERGLVYTFGETDVEIFERAEQGFPWTVYEDCPLLTQEGGRTRQIGRGWLACTAIRGVRERIGILYNDSALTGAPFDETKQSRVAIFCSLLGRALAPCLNMVEASVESTLDSAPSDLVRAVAERLGQNPSLSCDELARDLALSPHTLSRSFRRETNMSIVEYRNELRLARFLSYVDSEANSVADAAREAGFGSYAQFHRVFRARYGQSPRDYVTERRSAS